MANSQDLDSCFRDFENGSWGFFVNDLQGEEEYGSETEVQAGDINLTSSESSSCAMCSAECTQRLSPREAKEAEARIGMPIPFLCTQHYEEYISKYVFHNGRFCCDPLNKHKKRVTVGLVLNTLEMFKMNNLLIPGKKTCKPCRAKIMKNEKNKFESVRSKVCSSHPESASRKDAQMNSLFATGLP